MQKIQKTSAKLVGGRIFLDFINTVSFRDSVNPDDKLADFNSLLGWCCEIGIIDEAGANRFLRNSGLNEQKTWLRRAIKLREALYNICSSATANTPLVFDDLTIVNQEYKKALNNRSLIVVDAGFDWGWDDENVTEKILRVIADSAVKYFVEEDLSRLRKCGGINCGWIFEDTTRNRSRTWCDMKDCGNLAKVRRFRQKNK